jgi:hypothetical protein
MEEEQFLSKCESGFLLIFILSMGSVYWSPTKILASNSYFDILSTERPSKYFSKFSHFIICMRRSFDGKNVTEFEYVFPIFCKKLNIPADLSIF